jgi:hypothetical protein
MIRLLAIISTLAFGLSLFVHLSTFVAFSNRCSQLASILFGLSIALVVAAVASLGGLADEHRESGHNDEFAAHFLGLVPSFPQAVLISLVVYVVVTFAVVFVLTDGGAVSVVDGHYTWSQHAMNSRRISADEYYQYRAYELRLISSFDLIVSALPMIYFAVIRPKLNETRRMTAIDRSRPTAP